MKKALLFILAALLLSIPAAGDIILDDFQNFFNDDNRQTNIGAALGISKNNNASTGGGFWHSWADSYGSFVGNSDGKPVSSSSLGSLISSDGLSASLHLVPVFNENDSGGIDTVYGWCALAANFSGSSPNGEFYDFSGLTGIQIKISGTGSVRINLATKEAQSWEWGNFGYTLFLSKMERTYFIRVEDIKPDLYSPAFDSGKSFLADGASQVNSIVFGPSRAGDTVKMHISEITFTGISPETFGITNYTGPEPVSVLPGRKSGVPGVAVSCPVQFGPLSSVELNLSAPEDLELSVFSPSGALVRSLFSGHLEAGSYAIPWNGYSRDGTKAQKGLYIIGMQSKSGNVSRLVNLAD